MTSHFFTHASILNEKKKACSAIMTTACFQICYANMQCLSPAHCFLQVSRRFSEDAIAVRRRQSSPDDSKSATLHSLSGFPARTKTP